MAKTPKFRTARINETMSDDVGRVNADNWTVSEARGRPGAEREADGAGDDVAQSIVTPGPVNSASPRHSLAGGSFTQNWSVTTQITTNDDWSGVPAIVGYRGDNVTPTVGVDLRTLTANDPAPTIDVNANQTDPVVFNTGGVTEFDLANDTIALAGSATADAPYIVIYLDSTGRSSVRFQCNLRDLDSSADDAAQQVNIQYRTTPGGAWTNVTGGYFADVTQAGTATMVTAVDVTLPADAGNSATLEIRIMSINATGNDEWVGIDDIVVSSVAVGAETQTVGFSALTISHPEGDTGTTDYTFTITRTGGTTGVLSYEGDIFQGDTDGDDYPLGGATPGSFSGNIPAGEASQTITISVSGDTTFEMDEDFWLTLTTVNNLSGVTATISAPNATSTATIQQ